MLTALPSFLFCANLLTPNNKKERIGRKKVPQPLRSPLVALVVKASNAGALTSSSSKFVRRYFLMVLGGHEVGTSDGKQLRQKRERL